jgi:purine-cytosine permease-like protein
VTLKVVGAIPTIYQILHFVNHKPVLNSPKQQIIAGAQRNPDFAAAWAYGGFSRPAFTMANQTLRSDFVKFFTKKTNYNKLFIVAAANFFLSPGIVLRHYSDPTARHLKKRPKTWVYALTALKKVTQRP